MAAAGLFSLSADELTAFTLNRAWALPPKPFVFVCLFEWLVGVPGADILREFVGGSCWQVVFTKYGSSQRYSFLQNDHTYV